MNLLLRSASRCLISKRHHRQIISQRCNNLLSTQEANPLVATSSTATDQNQILKISDSCVAKLKKVAGKDEFLRVEVESGGCSGFQYKFNLDTKLNADDKIFERDGVKVVVDETSLQYLKGAVVDYNVELIRSSFQITSNPQAEQGCSCGASFTVKIN